MKYTARKALSILLALSIFCTMTVPAAASEAVGEELSAKDTLLHDGTSLSANVFWSSAYSDLRTEHLITYTPGETVTPIVTYYDVLTQRSTVSTMAERLEEEGYRVVAGINGDFFNTSTGLPIGLVVTEGTLRSSDGGYYAVGFRKDGTAILGKPGISLSADLGYSVTDAQGNETQLVRKIAAVNKVRVGNGGIYLYTRDFNDRHTTGTAAAGVEVLCTVTSGELAIGSTVTARVERVAETTTATAIGEHQFALSVNLESGSYYVDALRNLPANAEITLTIGAANEAWHDVEYAVGALYSLVEDGRVISNPETGLNPRTAVGQKADGTLVFYTMDGRRSGHSIGASMKQVSQRLIELGCVNALCLDGGGSTMLSITKPDSTAAEIVNVPSDGDRAVSNHIFLVAPNRATDRLNRFYVEPAATHVLAGSKVKLSVSAVDTAHIPMSHDYTLKSSAGTLSGTTLTTPAEGGTVTVTASGGGKTGSAAVHAVVKPDALTVYKGGISTTALKLSPGTTTNLSVQAKWNHLTLHADADAFSWSFEGSCGKVDKNGVFTATQPGTGTLTVSAAGVSASLPVTVTHIPLQMVEDFEGDTTIFDNTSGINARYGTTSSVEKVRLGRSAGVLDYVLTSSSDYAAYWAAKSSAEVNNRVFSKLNFWVRGDGSGNMLNLLYSDGAENLYILPAAALDFTGWKQIEVSIETETFSLGGWSVSAPEPLIQEDEEGNLITVAQETAREGTIYIDHIVASYGAIVDNTVPEVTAQWNAAEGTVTAEIYDAIDGRLPASAVGVSVNGVAAEGYRYDANSGKLTLPLEVDAEQYESIRITVTGRDASGNIGRASVNIDPVGVGHKFADIENYWAADYVDYLYNAGITLGYSDGTFRPNKNISRAQFATMLYRYLKLDEAHYADVELPFADADQISKSALPAVKALYAEGVLGGSTGADGKLYLNPNTPLTRVQAATMIGRTQEKGYAKKDLAMFADADKIPAYARDYISTMAAQGVIDGYSDKTFRPGNYITRGQMAKILYNLM